MDGPAGAWVGAAPGRLSSMSMVRVESLDLEGRGVARVAGKVTFIDAALPGESVEIEIWRRKPRFDLANAVRIVHPSSMRVTPPLSPL